MAIENRYEFNLFFDVENGNPNGDPDADGAPRIDPEDGHGLVSDVALKRRIRNYVKIEHENRAPYAIFIEHGTNLNRAIAVAHEQTGGIPSKAKKASHDRSDQARQWMCQTYYDVRTFGAVMATGANAGQVRGPVQIAWARSVDPVTCLDQTFTRGSVTEGEHYDSSSKLLKWENQQPWSKLQTMGRRALIPYALYQVKGYISAHQARETGFDEKDLELLWTALQNMFEIDRSSSKGILTTRALTIFKHVGSDPNRAKRARQAQLGCAPAHRLLEPGHVLTIGRIHPDKPPRRFADYRLEVDPGRLPCGVEITDIRC